MKLFSNKSIKNILSFSKKDRNGIFILSLLLLVLILANIFIHQFQFQTDQNLQEVEKIFAAWEAENHEKTDFQYLFVFDPNVIEKNKFDSLKLPSQIKSNLLKYRNAGGRFKQKEDLKKIYGMNDSIYNAIENFIKINKLQIAEIAAKPKNEIISVNQSEEIKFNLNSVGYDTLIKVGFNSFQTNNILKYRKAGGRFSAREDLLKIYGIDSITYVKVKHLAYITNENDVAKKNEESINKIIIELNTATEDELIKLQGIGQVYASRIIKYKKLLGGYFHKNQLLEVYNFPEETFINIEKQIVVDTTKTKKIRLNFADYTEFVKHPYINSATAKAILTYRSNHGNFSKLNEIHNITAIDSVLYGKLSPYLTCR